MASSDYSLPEPEDDELLGNYETRIIEATLASLGKIGEDGVELREVLEGLIGSIVSLCMSAFSSCVELEARLDMQQAGILNVIEGCKTHYQMFQDHVAGEAKQHSNN